jgi:hypothetical protein
MAYNFFKYFFAHNLPQIKGFKQFLKIKDKELIINNKDGCKKHTLALMLK